MLRAEDVMQSDVLSVRPETPLEELERAFLDARVTGFAVCENQRLLGVVSRSDVVRKLATERSWAGYVSDYYRDLGSSYEFEPEEPLAEIAARLGARLEGVCVRDVMSSDPVTVERSTPLADVAKLLSERGIHRVLVLDGDRLAGIITALDLVRLIADGRA